MARIRPRKEFRHFIAEHRAAHNPPLTQKQLAALLDTAEMTVSRWELYETRVDMPILAAVAEALGGGLEGEDLLRHPDDPSPNRLLRGLPATDRDHFIRQIKRAADE